MGGCCSYTVACPATMGHLGALRRGFYKGGPFRKVLPQNFREYDPSGVCPILLDSLPFSESIASSLKNFGVWQGPNEESLLQKCCAP